MSDAVYQCVGLGCAHRAPAPRARGCPYCGNDYERLTPREADRLRDAMGEIAAAYRGVATHAGEE